MLRLRCDYEVVRLDLVSGVEKAPQLCCYISRSQGGLVKQNLSQRGSFSFDLPVKNGQPFLKPSDMLHVLGFVAVKNEAGEWTSNEAGSSSMYLSELINPRSPVVKSLEMAIWNAYDSSTNSYPSKGALKLTIQPTDLSACPQPFLPLGEYDLTDANREKLVGNLANFLQRASTVYSQFNPTYSSTKYLHLPLYSWGQFQLPGQAFACVRADSRNSERWWVQAAEIALRSHYTRAESIEEARDLFLAEKDPNTTATVYAKMIGGTVNRVSTYLADGIWTNGTSVPVNKAAPVSVVGCGGFKHKHKKIKRVSYQLDRMVGAASPRVQQNTPSYIPIESFSVGKLRFARDPVLGVQGTGDCEDVTAEAGMLDNEFLTGSYSDPVLRKMNSIRQHYVFGQSLAGVRGQQLSDAERQAGGDSEHSNLGGHLHGLLIPVREYLRLHSRYNKANPSFEGLEQRVGPVGLKTMWVENTGLMEPSGDPNFYKLGQHLLYLMQNSGKTFVRSKVMQLTNRQTPNPFIKVVNSVAITDLAEEYATVEHMLLTSNGSGQWTLGADFVDLVNGREHISSFAMPEFTEEEIKTVRSVLEHRLPVPAYPDPVRSVRQPAFNEHLESVKQYVSKLKRRNVGNCQVIDIVTLYPNVDAEHSRNLRQLVDSKEKIVGFQYFDDNLGEGIGAYTQRFTISL